MTSKFTGPLYYEAFMNFFKDASFTPKVMLQANALQTVIALVVANMGITLTPSPIEAISGIALRQVEDIHFSIEASLGWRKDNSSEILKNFLAFFNEYHRTVIQNTDN